MFNFKKISSRKSCLGFGNHIKYNGKVYLITLMEVFFIFSGKKFILDTNDFVEDYAINDFLNIKIFNNPEINILLEIEDKIGNTYKFSSTNDFLNDINNGLFEYVTNKEILDYNTSTTSTDGFPTDNWPKRTE